MRIERSTAHESLLKTINAATSRLPAVCGGNGTCGKCAVRVLSGFVPASAADSARFTPEELEKGWRLACTTFPADEISVEIPDTGGRNFSIVDTFAALPDTSQTPHTGSCLKKYAIAVDLGTTTLSMALLECAGGNIIARYSTLNRQREYGADVISRIKSANEGNLRNLSGIVRSQISEGIRSLCIDNAIDKGQIGKIAIAGNTTMLHILRELSCAAFGQSPFTPVALDMAAIPYREIFEGDLDCDAVILPGISAYVGADITAGILFTGLHTSTAPSLLVDIGTNGEIALAYKGKLLCAATAAGPAFEGGNIQWGTGSVGGAICRAQYQNNQWNLSTINNEPTLGICGSGLVDIAHQGLLNGLIHASGRFSEAQQGSIFLAKTQDGRDITLSQKDLRELQLAKSAIRSGIDALLSHAGLAYSDIQTLYIAGGFGFHLNMESAAGIGLIPEPLLPKVFLTGNSSLGGLVKYLCASQDSGPHSCGPQLRLIAAQASEYSLPQDKFFSDSFIRNLDFE